MLMSRVWITYEPLVYGDAIARFLQGMPSIEIVSRPSADVDVVVLALPEAGWPNTDRLVEATSGAKLVALSPRGDRGFVRVPGKTEWEEIRPFGLALLSVEVHAGRGRPASRPVHSDGPVPLAGG